MWHRPQANVLMGIKPGGVFVHRNISNICNHSDLSMLRHGGRAGC